MSRRGDLPGDEEDDDALPWLEPAATDDDDGGEGAFPYRGLVVAGVAIVVIVALLWLVAEQFGGTGRGPDIVSTGDVALIQAPEGPYKVRPDEPGGLDVDDDSLTHAVAEGADPGSRIAVDSMPEEPVPVAAPVRRAPVPAPVTTVEVPLPPMTPVTTQEAKDDAAAVKRPPAPVAKKPVPEAAPPAAQKPAVKPATEAPTPAPAGGAVTVQLGAFSDTATADRVWTKLAGRVPALGGLRKSVQPVEVGGKTLYRLRAAGVASSADAASLCGQVKGAGEQCAVVR